MIRYIPEFILHQYALKKLSGSLRGYALLIDVVDFTHIGSELQKHGKQGAEEISRFLDDAFCVPIEIVTRYGGFVSLFAGDAFCAIFPETSSDYIISAVNSTKEYIQNKKKSHSILGDFVLKVRQAVSFGDIQWQIFENDIQNEYIFLGDPITELGELFAYKEDIIFSDEAARKIGEDHFSKLTIGYSLNSHDIIDVFKPIALNHNPEDKSRFIHSKFRIVTPQNEIRSAAFCFANLDKIAMQDREKAIRLVQYKANKYGGFVNKYDATDKGIVAVILFGLPQNDGKTLERICNFSLEIVENCQEIAIGICCGSLFAGYTGYGDIKEYTALGPPMNLSSRLMNKARPGEVLTDTFLWMEMNCLYDFEYLGSLNLKGIDLPVRYYHLSRQSRDNTWHLESRFVGRDFELTAIRSLIDFSIKNSENSIIYISGDAGIGKSRLAKEAIVPYSKGSCHCFMITCDSILSKSLEAIKQIVRAFFYYNPQLPNEAGMTMFRGLWKDLACDEAELMRIESMIANLLGYDWADSIWSMLPPEDKPRQLKDAFISFIEKIARTKPVLIHLDDGQWIDVESKIFLQELSANSKSPIFIVASCRYLDNGIKVDLELSNHKRTDIELSNLSDAGSTELIKSILRLGHVPDTTLNLIIDRAMGNPFFIEQITSYLMECDSIDEKGLIAGEKGYLNSFSISDIMSSRIDRLTEQVQECMFKASVLGMEFNTRVLSKMISYNIKDSLEAGENNRIWKNIDELRYIFTHILIRDIVYQRILSGKLQQLHKSAAEAMEAIYMDKLQEYAEDIAYHFEKGNFPLKAADYYNKASFFCKEQFDFNKAESNLCKALLILETALGIGHQTTTKTIQNLADIYWKQGNYQKVEDTYLDALKKYETTLGTEHPVTADTLNNLAYSYYRQFKYDQAELLFLRALEIRKNVLGFETLKTAESLENLANLYSIQAKYDQAESLFLKALSILEKVKGKYHPDTAGLLRNLAYCYYHQGQYDLAEPLFLRVHEVLEKGLGAEHPHTLLSLDSLANLYRHQCKYDQAETLYLESLEMLEKVEGGFLKSLCPLHNLDILYGILGKDSQMEHLYIRSLNLSEKIYGKEHFNTSDSIHSLAKYFTSQGKYDQAEPLSLSALEVREKVLGAEHPRMIELLDNLANIYRLQNKFCQAETLYLRVLELSKRTFGAEHPQIASALNSLGRLYGDIGKFTDAESLHVKSLEIFEKVLGASHPNTAISMTFLANMYISQGKCDKAESLLLKALQILESKKGLNHPMTIAIKNNYNKLCESMGDNNKQPKVDLNAK